MSEKEKRKRKTYNHFVPLSFIITCSRGGSHGKKGTGCGTNEQVTGGGREGEAVMGGEGERETAGG